MTFPRLFAPVENSPLILFRILFGLLIFLECGGAIFTGWVEEVFISPKYAITFIGFEWLQPLPGNGMYFYYALMALLGAFIALGLFYKFSVALFTLMWTATYLMQKTHYNNHYYLLILLSLFMLIVPAHRYFSLDVRRSPSIRSFICPRWCLLIFMLQVGIVFTYAALAKLYPDWLYGKPVGIWFSSKTDYALIGPLFAEGWFKWFIVYGGIAFDLLITPMMLWRRTRIFGFCLCIFFNLFNSVVFQIGVFPYLMVALMVFFFPPETIRRIFFRSKPNAGASETNLNELMQSAGFSKKIIVPAVGLYFLWQLLLPLRHLLFPGNVHWTEEGHRMAWHMMLRTKSGSINFEILDAQSGRKIDFSLEDHFSYEQRDEMAKRPDITWQGVQIIKEILREKGHKQVKIFAKSEVSLNGSDWKPLIKPNVNLAKVKWENFSHSHWVTEDTF